MRKKTKDNNYYLPIVFMPYFPILPGTTETMNVTNFINTANIVYSDCTHKKVFIPFIDGEDLTEDQFCEDFENGKFIMPYGQVGIVCSIRHVEVKEKIYGKCDVTVTGIGRGICITTEYNSKTSSGLFGTIKLLEDANDVENFEVYRGLISRLLKRFAGKIDRVENETVNISSVIETGDANILCYKVFQTIGANYQDHIKLISLETTEERLKFTIETLKKTNEYVETEERILVKTGMNLSKQQKDAFLHEQMRVISEELGEDEQCEADELDDRLSQVANFMEPDSVEKLSKEINRLRRIPSASPDYSVIKMHADFVLGLPWEKEEHKEISLDEVKEILDRDHYGLKKVKDRIVEFMAVKTMKKATATSIICLYGPPGTGKTSIVKSIAEALGRKYVRISLGGVRDEAEIRGHRKTYVGAMAGRILTAIEKAKSNSPVLLLDEIDKISGDFKGDPSAALLEVLDPEQNKEFVDTYAEVPFDLSDVLFITTANSLETIPTPLLDRMEVIELSSYTEKEKIEIAKRHLIPKQIKEHGLTKTQVKFSDGAIIKLINEYTMEAGVRSLERQIATILRKSIIILKTSEKKSVRINEDILFEMLGAGKAIHRFDTSEGRTEVGVVNGMAWTSVGGVLLSIEVNVLPGTGKLEITGLLGDVMKESCVAAMSYIRSKANDYTFPDEFWKNKDIHIHVPEGATPKDGPSAGVTITTAILSALSGIPVKQSIAMTGEVNIRGDVLAIGGLKEKSLAALKEGIKEILVPAENEGDVRELPEEVLENVKITMVKTMDEVLERALVK